MRPLIKVNIGFFGTSLCFKEEEKLLQFNIIELHEYVCLDPYVLPWLKMSNSKRQFKILQQGIDSIAWFWSIYGMKDLFYSILYLALS